MARKGRQPASAKFKVGDRVRVKHGVKDGDYGILCEARMEGQVVTLPLGELEEPSRNRKVLRDYCYWFHNWS